MIHILQLLCPQRHCYVAVAWDDTKTTEALASFDLGLATSAMKPRGQMPTCAIRGATDFRREDGVTRFATIEEAAPHLEASQLAQLITREHLTRTSDRN